MEIDSRLRAELVEIARGNSHESSQERRLEAEQNWQSRRNLPVLAAIGIIGLSAVAAPALAFAGQSQYFALGGMGCALALAVYRLNTSHKKAYVDLRVAQGLDRRSAEKEYEDRYSSS
jgi:hypothetical protein